MSYSDASPIFVKFVYKHQFPAEQISIKMQIKFNRLHVY